MITTLATSMLQGPQGTTSQPPANSSRQSNQGRHQTLASRSPILVVIDAGVTDSSLLAEGVVEGANVVILERDRDGITQITEALKHYCDALSLHIVSHGAPGCLYLGNTELSLKTLDRYSWDLQSWAASLDCSNLRPLPQILFYGCEVAAGRAGTQLIHHIHQLTGLPIAASSTKIGSASLGGNWTLDVAIGSVQPELAFLSSTQSTYTSTFMAMNVAPVSAALNQTAQSTESRRISKLVLIDSTVEDVSSLINGVSADAEVILLNPEQDGIEQITQIASGFSNVESLHLVSHGVPGALNLAGTQLNLQTLGSYAHQLKQWSTLFAGAELLIYGCKVALGEVGQAFVQKLSELTGIAIAASTTPTGNAALGGNWELEIHTGNIQSALAFREETMANYAYVLASDALPNLVYTIAGTTVSVTSTVNNTTTAPTNPFTGATINNTLAFTTNANARDPLSSNQILYYISADGSNRIGTWNPVTGVATSLATISGAPLDSSPRMAFRDNGQLYVMNSNVLYTVSTGTGLGTGNTAPAGTVTSTTTLTGVGTGGGGDMAFDPANPNTLYVAGTSTNSLYRVTFTGATPSMGTLVGAMGGSSPGLAFGFDGSLYSSDGTNLYRVSLSNGTRTNLGAAGSGISDMASLPTPSTDVDLSVTITDSQTSTTPGGPITYTITVTNTGAYNLYGVSIADTFSNPNYTGTASWTAAPASGVSFRTAGDQTGTGNMNVKVNLDAGATVTYTVTGLVASGAMGSSFSNTVTVKPPEGITDKAGNPGANTATDTTTIAPPDTTAPIVTVNPLTTKDNTPQLTGTVNDPTAVVKVTVNGTTYTATNNGNGTWSLADNAITPALMDGKYDVTVTATDGAGNIGTEATTQELTVDTTAPMVTVNLLTTNDNTPQLTGTVDDPAAVVKVTVNGTTYTATNNGNGTWSLADNAITPALMDGKYDVTVTATDGAGNIGTEATTQELTVDTIAPMVTVNPLTTKDNTPQLTGTVNDPAAVVKVTVNGTTYTATNNGNGTWTLPDNAITPALVDGKFDVTVTATDTAGNIGTESTTQELTVDTIAPMVTVNLLTTNDNTPQLTGTVNDPAAVVKVTVDGTTYTATNNGDGTWTLPDNAITPALVDGKFDVTVTATDAAGNIGTEATTQELTVDTTAPMVTVNPLTTKDNTPQLTGTVNDPAAVVKVTVDGTTYTATNNGDGTWTLPDNAITSALVDGKYDVTVTATDGAGNIGTEATTQELTVDAPPVVTVNLLTTKDSTPQLTGTVDDPAAVVKVTVDGTTYTATNNGDGTWSLADNAITSALVDGEYDVTVTATDGAGNIGTEATTQELTVDTTAPIVTVNLLTTKDNTPQLTGTVNDPAAVVKVTVDGTTYTATNNGDGTWSLADNAITPALADGKYDVTVTATDGAGNIGTEATTQELTVDTTAPIVTVNLLTTKDNTPQLTGTVNDPAAVVKVTVDGTTYTATNNGDGTWSLADNAITPALVDGKFDVTVTATDTAGNIGTEATTQELTVDTTAPIVTVNLLTTKDNTPQLTGTVDDPTAVVKVTVDGTTYTATNKGDGTWSLADDAITPALVDGKYDVTVTATDGAGNIGTEATTQELTVDTIAPMVTVNLLTTKDNTPQLTGTVDDPAAVVKVTVDGTTYTATNKGDGTWTLPDNAITPALADGKFDVTVTATDAASNIGTEATTQELTVDTTAPIVTVNLLTTKDNTPQLTGTVDDPAAVVKVTVDGTTYTATNNGDGTWSLADDAITPVLMDGKYDVTVTATDGTGNIGTEATTQELSIDTVLNASIPDLSAGSDTGASNSDNITNVTQPIFTGSIDPDVTQVEVFIDGTSAGLATISGTTWSFTPSTPLGQGNHAITTQVSDVAGNKTPSSPLNITVDVTTPAPSIPDLSAGSDTGASNSDNITNVTQPIFTGSIDPDVTQVEVFIDGTSAGLATISGTTWSFTPSAPLGQGNHAITTQVSDVAGNKGAESTPLDIQILNVDLAIDQTSLGENNGKATLTATIGAVSDKDVVVHLQLSGTANSQDYTLPTTLTIKAGQTTGSVELIGVDDFLVEGSETVVIDILGVDNAVENGTQQVTATLTDNDTAGITVTPTSLLTSEGGLAANFDVVLTSQPTSDVTVTLTNGNTAEGALDQTTLTFTAANWNVAQTVTVTGQNDNVADGSVAYTIQTKATSSDLNYNNISGADVTVTNADNDTPGVTVSSAGLVTSESGSSATFSVILNTQPIGDVIVTLNNPSSEGTLDKTSLTFNSSNWNQPQTVTVTGVDDSIDDGDISYTIQTAASSSDPNYNNVVVADVTVTNTDNDTAGVTITPSVQVAEGGVTDSYSVVLNSQPTGDVTVTINNGSQTSTNVSTLTFTAANWNVAQSVVVTAVDDAIAEGNHTGTITHTISSTDPKYDGLAAASVTSMITDNDVAGVLITPSGGTTNLVEGGATDTYTVVLNTRPSSDVTLTISNGSQTSTDVTTLTFTAANWNIAQTVTVNAIDDLVAEGNHKGTITHTATSADAEYNGISITSVNGAIADNDTASVTITSNTLTTSEAGGAATFDVVLTSQPTSDVVVTLVNGNTAEGTLSTSSLTFTSSNWNTAQTVTVTGVDDLVDDGDVSYTIQTGITSNDATYSAINPVDIIVTNTDNDLAGVNITSANGIFTTEAGGTATFNVVLTSRPTANVVVNLVSSNPGEGKVPTSVTFTPTDWNVAQTVTVTGVDDFLVDGNQSYTIQTSITSTDVKYGAIDPADVTLTNTDNDSAGVTITQTNGNTTVAEAGATDTYTLVLNSQPTGNVTVTLGTDNQTTVSQTVLTFTPGNWNQAQTVTVTATDDALVEGNHNSVITHTVSSTDANYNGATIVPVTVTVGDNDSAGVIITPVDSQTSEDGSTGSFRVVLSSQPTQDVVLNFGSQNIAEGQVSQNSITFNSTNWNQAQTITVSGVDDDVVDGQQSFSIQTTTVSNDSNYSGLKVAPIAFTNTDNDQAGVLVQAVAGLTTTEAGGQATFSMVLTSQPTADVVIKLVSSNPAEGKVPASITFTAANWNTPQTVTVTGVDDTRVDGNIKYKIQTSITSTDANYAAIDPKDIEITNLDNEFNTPPTASNVNSQIAPAKTLNLTGLLATDVDGSVTHYTIKTVPSSTQGALYLGNPEAGGKLIVPGQNIKPDQITQLFFQSSAGFNGSSFTYTTTDNLGKTSNLATVTLGALNSQDLANAGCSTRKGLVLKGNNHKNKLFGTNHRDRLVGRGGNDLLRGGKGADVLQGNKGKDRLFGQDCNDALSGGFGNDRLSGGRGYDKLNGGRGNDLLRGDDHGDRLSGGAGNDVLKGGRGNDQMKGGIGNDRFFGNRDNDTMSGGRGDDRLRGSQGNDKLSGGTGRDRLFGGGNDDKISGGLGNDGLRGGSGNDLLRGGSGIDRVEGGAGNDRVDGGRGNDSLDGGRGNDVLKGGLNRDVLKGRQGDDILSGGRGNDLLKGAGGRDVLKGDQDNDSLFGAGQADRLIGGSGNDQLTGGSGDDILTGGKGRDRFIYTKFGEQLGDRITDFEIDQDALDLRRLLGKVNINTKILKDQVQLIQTGSDTTVRVDLNGKAAGGVETLITLENVNANTLSTKNFIL